MGSWHCDVCTFFHQYPFPKCAMCSAPRSVEATILATSAPIQNSGGDKVVSSSTAEVSCNNVGTTTSAIATTTANGIQKKIINPYLRGNKGKAVATVVQTVTIPQVGTKMDRNPPCWKGNSQDGSTNLTPAALTQTVISSCLKDQYNVEKPPTKSVTTTSKVIPNPYLKSKGIRTINVENNNSHQSSMMLMKNNNIHNTQEASDGLSEKFSTTRHLAVDAPNDSNTKNQNFKENSSLPSPNVSTKIPSNNCYSSSIKKGPMISDVILPTPVVRNITTLVASDPAVRNTGTIVNASSLSSPARTTSTASAFVAPPTGHISSNTDPVSSSNTFFQPRKGKQLKTFRPGPITIDPLTKDTYIYPVNPHHPKRRYQCDITRTALFHNTLVSLPTGLGKTLIAAVVMYNYRRWFKANGGKVVFCAPTRPLVTQQIKACYQIMGMPLSETAEISGKTPPVDRKELWMNRHVFFCTPQTLMKDLSSGNLDGSAIVCLVLDEAHKATGKYDYVSVIPLLEEAGARFRILGLSATPGTSIKSIQEVINNLRISKIEVRLETDPDVVPYIHDRQMEIVMVKTNTALAQVEELWLKVMKPILQKLRKSNALITVRAKDDSAITPWCIKRAQAEWHERHAGDDRSALDQWFSAAAQLVGITQDLRYYGIGMVKTRLERIISNPKFPKMRSIIAGKDFQDAWREVLAASSSSADADEKDLKKNNPKLEKLEEVLVEHFERKKAVGESTRAIVFSQYRDAVEEIVNLLLTKRPLLKPNKFVGQATTSRNKSNKRKNSTTLGTAGMKQWEQQQAIQDFSSGKINVLVCTCIGEEGLDIGEVDLIVNFDCLKSPIRMIQRFGRTGRKRDGRVICLIAEGAEQSKHAQSEQSTKTLGRALKQTNSFRFFRDQYNTSSYAIFPSDEPLPVIHEQEMDLSEDYRLSLVGGYLKRSKPSTETAMHVNYRIDSCSAWRLTHEQEDMRRREYGAATSYFLDDLSNLHEEEEKPIAFPLILRRKFLRARQRGGDTPQHSTSMGVTRSILKTFLQKIGPETIQHSSAKYYSQIVSRRNERKQQQRQHLKFQDAFEGSYEYQSRANRRRIQSANHHESCDIEETNLSDTSISLPLSCNDDGISWNDTSNANECMNGNYSNSFVCTNLHDDESEKCRIYENRIDVGEPNVMPTRAVFCGKETLEIHSFERERNMSNCEENYTCNPSASMETLGKERKTHLSNKNDAPYNAESNLGLDDQSYSKGIRNDIFFVNGGLSSTELHTDEDAFRSHSNIEMEEHESTTHNDLKYDRTNGHQNHESQDKKDDSARNYIINFRLPTPVSSSDESHCTGQDDENSECLDVQTKIDNPPECGTEPNESLAGCVVDKLPTPISFFLPAGSSSSSSSSSVDNRPEDLGTNAKHTEIGNVKCKNASKNDAVHCKEISNFGLKETPDQQEVTFVNQVLPDIEADLNAFIDSIDETPVISVRRKSRRNFILTDISSPLGIASSDNISPCNGTNCESANSEKEEEIICLLCHCADSTDEDPIVLCDGPNCDFSCNVAVHKSCYQINIDLAAVESWRCEPCEERQKIMMNKKFDGLNIDASRIFCSICNISGGAMKRTPAPEYLWVHPLCMYWTPRYATLSTVFQEGNRLGGGEIITIADLHGERITEERVACLLCRRKHGAVKCSEPTCTDYAHPHCAVESSFEKRWFFIHHRLSNNLNNKVSYKFVMYCTRHKSFAAGLVGRSGNNATEIFGGLSAWKKRNRPKAQTGHLSSWSTQAIGLVDSDEDCKKPTFSGSSNQQKRRLKSLKRLEARKQLKSDDGANFKKRIKAKGNHRKRLQYDAPVRRFFDEEAELDSGEEVSSDSFEERLVEQMEGEYSQDSFIDDSTQLLYSQYPLSAPGSAISPGCDDGDVMLHRRVNNELEKSKLFATPILNRRMRRSPGCSGESLAGLGNMCFIRSVIEHHRQGGGMTQVEIEFNRQHGGQEQYCSSEHPKSKHTEDFCDGSWKASDGVKSNVIACPENKENSTLKLERLDTWKSNCHPDNVLKIDLDIDIPARPPNIPPANQLHTPEVPKSVTAYLPGTMTDTDIGALIEQNRQAALRRYQQKVANAIKNPYSKSKENKST